MRPICETILAFLSHLLKSSTAARLESILNKTISLESTMSLLSDGTTGPYAGRSQQTHCLRFPVRIYKIEPSSHNCDNDSGEDGTRGTWRTALGWDGEAVRHDASAAIEEETERRPMPGKRCGFRVAIPSRMEPSYIRQEMTRTRIYRYVVHSTLHRIADHVSMNVVYAPYLSQLRLSPYD